MALRKIGLCAFIVLAGVLLFGCSLGGSHSFFFDSVCQPPCWQNIYPGVTTKEEALVILRGLPNIDQQRISTKGFSWLIFEDTIFFHPVSKSWDGSAYTLDHKVTILDFHGNLHTNFGEAIKENGEPKYVLNIPVHHGPPGFPTLSYIITALDPHKGVAYTYDTADLPMSKRGELRPDTPISLISYFDPESYDELMEAEIFSMGVLLKENPQKYLRPWTGFGSIKEKYRPAAIR